MLAFVRSPGFGLRWEAPLPGLPAINYSAALRYDLGAQGARSADDSAGVWTDEGVWVFFAASYDSSSGALKVYRGYRNKAEAGLRPAEATLTASMALSAPNSAGISPVGLGYQLLNRAGNDRSFDGLLDNIRIDGSTADGSGALGLKALEAYRVGDVAGVRESTPPAVVSETGRLAPGSVETIGSDGGLVLAAGLAAAAGAGLAVAHYRRRRTQQAA